MATLRALILSLLLVVLLAACSQASDPTNPTDQFYAATPGNLSTAVPAAGTPATAFPATSVRMPGCTTVSRDPSPGPTQASIVPPPAESDRTLGPADAAVSVIVYCDYQSPGCAYVAPVLESLSEKYPDDVRVVYRHYPLVTLYDKAALASQAAEAAGLQDKFWEMQDRLYARQQEWAELTEAQFEDWLTENAADLELDVDQFENDRSSPEVVKAVNTAYEQNAALGMPGTPFLFINGEPYQGPPNAGDLEAIVALTLLEERQFSDCPAITVDAGKQYLAVVHTEKGDITLELFADKAPLAVNSFVFLAREGWFDGITFHRVIPGFMAQTGDPTGTGFGGPGYAFDNELSDLSFDQPGVVGMANAGPGSNGSQFFITYAAAPHLDGGFTIFGRLVSGMDVLEELTPRNPAESGDLPPGDKILSVEIQEK